ncbi:MAG TPA: Nif3-like dinuclear metal center hexameric protein [Patescibacteria group bacterium]|nr:Nif3-like dinuclear metal center hexameric protein [Patescibacteria group bacterium]
MSVKCQCIMDAMEKLAPCYLAESWDNVGLLLGEPQQEIHRVLVVLDVDDHAVELALREKVQLLVSHHPLIFKSLTALRTDTPVGRRLAQLIKQDIAVYSAHTNLDATVGGVNDALARALRLSDVKPLDISYREPLVKLVVFVPVTHREMVWQAIADAGAGHIGNYSHCSFQTTGVGTFLPLNGAVPFIGQLGTVEETQEVRLETIVREQMVSQVVQAMRAAHPYEEVAFDEYPLRNTGQTAGLGRVGILPDALPFEDFIIHVKQALKLPWIRVAGKCLEPIRKVAVCGGSGAGYIAKAWAAGAQVLITGDVKYHEAQEAAATGLVVLDAGHFATEYPVVAEVASYLRRQAAEEGWGITPEAILNDGGQTDIFVGM